VLRHLDRVIPAEPDRPEVAGPGHPMQAVTRQIAFEPTGWDPTRRAKVAKLFDDLAPTWHEREELARLDPLTDALDRGGPFPTTAGPCLELGSGVGLMTPTLTARFDTVIAVDLSLEMLARAAATTPRVLTDSAALPFADHGAGAVVLVNMFLFPTEIDRVLADDGVLLWVSTLGENTPIYLPPADVAAAMPGEAWHGVTAEAGWGTWAVLRRA
jgi:hypothetical protein